MTVVNNGMNLLAVPSEWQHTIIAVLIIFTVIVDLLMRKRLVKAGLK